MEYSDTLSEARGDIEAFEKNGMTKAALINLESAVDSLNELYCMKVDESQIASNILNLYFDKVVEKIRYLLSLDTLPDERLLKYWFFVLRRYKGIEAIDQNVFMDLLDKIGTVVRLGKGEFKYLSPKRRWIKILEMREGINADDFDF